ncbi:ABC transporter permease [Marinitenerispora sediminis]|uniref:Transport permease protein n=1 Tax=Marinitenerispora sediminis TaxID=1931232 RepID=A0A368T272_9ACTN|nr:ABC transporter permease [Marinitenerispora sediminis]RCV48948.1 ABC transporter [Marinitenerispora sediminis]RCV51599.1 ABC transporter [Marinitenerispora sediminis]RCV55301.1 ABC transporter [Marinitenerispora sediminis]
MTALARPAARTRVAPTRALRHGLTLASRNIRHIVRSPATLLDTVVQPIAFLLVFAFLFGGAISGGWQPYLQTLVPGLMVQIALYASMGTGLALHTDISKGVFDRFRSLPIARSAPLVGAVLGDVVRYAVAVGVLLALAFALGFRVQTGPLPALLAFVLVIVFGLTLCWLSVLVGLVASSPQAVPGIATAVVLPLTFGSNIFADPATMPGWLQLWVRVNPVTHFVDAVRGLLLGGQTAGPLAASLVAVIALHAVLLPLAVRAYLRRTG